MIKLRISEIPLKKHDLPTNLPAPLIKFLRPSTNACSNTLSLIRWIESVWERTLASGASKNMWIKISRQSYRSKNETAIYTRSFVENHKWRIRWKSWNLDESAIGAQVQNCDEFKPNWGLWKFPTESGNTESWKRPIDHFRFCTKHRLFIGERRGQLVCLREPQVIMM
jgi:hypothetical protein